MTRATHTRPPAPAREVTYEEFMAMPVTNRHVEVVDGVVNVMPSPDVVHQLIQGKLYRRLDDHVSAHDLGIVVLSPSDVLIRKRPKLRVRQPDVMVYTNARAGCRVIENLGLIRDGSLAPSLAIEVLSPGQTEETLEEKLADYAAIGVDELWLADQPAKAIQVLVLDGDRYRPFGVFGVGQRVGSQVLAGIDLEVAPIFM